MLYDELQKILNLETYNKLKNLNADSITIPGNASAYNIAVLKGFDKTKIFDSATDDIKKLLISLATAKITFDDLKIAIDTQSIQEAAKVLYDELQKILNLETYNKLKNLDADSITIPGNGSPYNIVVLKGFDKSKSFAGVTFNVHAKLKTLASLKITFIQLQTAINIQSKKETALLIKTTELYNALKNDSDILTKLKNLTIIRLTIRNKEYDIPNLKNFNKIENYTNSSLVIKTELKALATAKITFNDLKTAIKKATLYQALKSLLGLAILKILNKLQINKIKINNIFYDITEIKKYKGRFDQTFQPFTDMSVLLKKLVQDSVTFTKIQTAVNKFVQLKKTLYIFLKTDSQILNKLRGLIVDQITINGQNYGITEVKKYQNYFDQTFKFPVKREIFLEKLAQNDVTSTKIKTVVNAFYDKRKLLLQNFQNQNSILSILKNKAVKQIKIDGKVFSFQSLLKVKD